MFNNLKSTFKKSQVKIVEMANLNPKSCQNILERRRQSKEHLQEY